GRRHRGSGGGNLRGRRAIAAPHGAEELRGGLAHRGEWPRRRMTGRRSDERLELVWGGFERVLGPHVDDQEVEIVVDDITEGLARAEFADDGALRPAESCTGRGEHVDSRENG